MIKNILLCITLASFLSARCLEGCLRCSEDNKCLYCNVQKGYQLRSGLCLKPQIPNCVLTNEKSQCIRCQDDFYLDTAVNKCLELPPVTKVENCSYHSEPYVCGVCKTGFYLKNGACNKISSPIKNCSVENEWGICKECEVGYIRSIDKKSCNVAPEHSGCATQQLVKCRECSKGYLENKNYYHEFLYQFKTKRDLNELTDMRQIFKNRLADAKKFPTCQPIGVSNCSVYKNANTCSKCEPLYFVNKKGRCELNPISIVDNCLRYSSLTTCVLCYQGYRLNAGNCTKVHNIENCLEYKQNADSTVCTRCHNDYYLSAKNLCTQRTEVSQINLCQELAVDFEKCTKCLKGNLPTSDGFKCLSQVDNCELYQRSTKNTTQLICKKCQPGFYYQEEYNVCIKGTVEFCNAYKHDDDVCVECQSKFYLIENKCFPQPQIPFCNQYDPTERNTCIQCDVNNFLFERTTSCQKVTRIPKCKEYLNKTSCKECDYGYYLRNSSECVPISMSENCLVKENNQCVKCLPHFAILEGKCVKAFDWVMKGCAENNLNGETNIDNLECKSCRPNFVPIEAKNTFICTEQKVLHQMINLNKDQSFDPDCVQYQIIKNTKTFKCLKCDKNKVLVEGVCRENCTLSTKRTVYKQWVSLNNNIGESLKDSIRIEQINVCETTIPNCAVASLDVDQDFGLVKYSCEKCMEGHIAVIDQKANAQISKHSENEREINLHMPMTGAPGIQCVPHDQNIMVGKLNTLKSIDQCEYYTGLGQNRYGCGKCFHGQTGVAIQTVENCEVYKNWDQCKKCQPMFYLASQSECRPVEKIENCFEYDGQQNHTVCQKCQDNYYLNNQECKERVLSLGIANCQLQTNLDNCTCENGYVQDPNNLQCYKKPDNCENATVNDQQITCSACNRQISYLNQATCIVGTINNCNKYQTNADVCLECVNGFYLQNGICKPHTANLDSKCELWDIVNKDVCTKCNKSSTKFYQVNKCQSVFEAIPHCAEYSDLFSCVTCDEGYYLNNVSKRCLQIPLEMHCKKLSVVELINGGVFDKNDYTEKIRYLYTCDLCEVNYYRRQYSIKENYYVDPNQNTEQRNLFQCVDWLNYHNEQCTTSNTEIDGKENFGKFCYGCNSESIPFNIKNQYTCVNKKYLIERKHGLALNTNCKAYEYDSSRNMVCKYCQYPYFLDDTKGICIDGTTTACTNGSPHVMHISASGKVTRNICQTVQTARTGCLQFVTGVSHDSANNTYSLISGCFKCDIANGHYPRVLVTAANIDDSTFINALDQDPEYRSRDQNFPILECVQNGGNLPFEGIPKSSEIENCALYRIGTNKIGCIRCKQGYHGRVVVTNDGGYIEFCQKMTSCQQGHALSGLNQNSKFGQTYEHPLTYFSCQKCTNTAHIPVAFVDMTTTMDPTASFLNLFYTSNVKGTLTMKVFGADALTMANQPQASFQTQCWDSTKLETLNTETDYLTQSNPSQVPTNCGLVIVDTGVATQAVKCVACKSGYYPAGYDGGVAWMINDCQPIPTCTTPLGTSLNSCDNCVYKYTESNNQVSNDPATQCIKDKGTTKCLAGVLDGNGDLVCKQCDPDYMLNSDGTCFKIKTEWCQAGFSNFSDNYNKYYIFQSKRLSMYAAIQYNQLLPGCSKCTNSNDVLYKANVSTDVNIRDHICAKIVDTADQFSSAIRTAQIASNTSLQQISNCNRYGYLKSKYICVECQTNFTLNKEEGVCEAKTAVATANHPNCLIAKTSSSTDCEVCESGYTNIGGLCRANNDSNYVDANCQTPAEAQKTSYQSICSKCASGYYAKVTNPPFNRCTPIPATETNCVDFLDETGCVKCSDGYGLTLIKNLNIELTKRVCVKMDFSTNGVFDHDPNCQSLKIIADSDSLNQQRLICRQCKANSVLVQNNINYKQRCYPVVPEKNNCKIINKPDENLNIMASQLGVVKTKDFKCLECENQATHYLNLVTDQCLNRTLISDCELYDQNEDKCKKCLDGFYLNSQRNKCLSFKTNKNKGYLDVCKTMESCNSSVEYEGLNSQFNSLYSCHSCKDTTKIPFAVGILTLDEKVPGFEKYDGFKSFNQNFEPFRNNEVIGQPVVQCLEPTHTSFGLTQLNFSFPTNCGLGFVNLSNLLQPDNNNVFKTHDATHSQGNIAFDINKATIRCSACKPGFKAEKQSYVINNKSQELGFFVKGCTIIANCENSTWFNNCSQCKAGFAYEFTNNGVQFDTCIPVPNIQKGCWAYENSTTRCKLCRKGAYLNKDYICEEINPPNCQPKSFRFNQEFVSRDVHQGLYFSEGFVGCNSCDRGYVGVLQEEPKQVCVESQYHIKNSLITNTFYINGCTRYSFEEGRLTCSICKDGLVRSINKQKCFANNTLSNCKQATSTTHCTQCKENYVLVDGQCQAPNIQNCVKYGNNEDKRTCQFCGRHDQVCIQCDTEYYLEGNQCIKGQVKNCQELETSKICKRCKDNFTLILIDNGLSYCYPMDDRHKCKKFKQDKFQAHILDCDECLDNTYVLSPSHTDRPESSCMQFNVVERCQEYENNPIALGDSSLVCKRCDKKSYLNNGTCQLRSVVLDECINYAIDADKCLTCEEGYFLADGGVSCTPYPQGIFGCQEYLNQNTCIKCIPEYYLDEDKCHPVTKLVANCDYYEDNGICSGCKAPHLKFRGKCYEANAKDCLTYEHINACKTCAPGSNLEELNGIINCVQTTITNCLVVDNVAPYNCIRCQGEFYPKEKECVAITAAIIDCQQYNSATTCSKCSPTTILKNNGTECMKTPESMSHVDLNCSDSFQLKEPVCNTCKPGYTFVYNSCIPCPEDMIAQGCYTCDPNNNQKCLMCSTGWIQTPEGICRKKLIDSTGFDDRGRSLEELRFNDQIGNGF